MVHENKILSSVTLWKYSQHYWLSRSVEQAAQHYTVASILLFPAVLLGSSENEKHGHAIISHSLPLAAGGVEFESRQL